MAVQVNGKNVLNTTKGRGFGAGEAPEAGKGGCSERIQRRARL